MQALVLTGENQPLEWEQRPDLEPKPGGVVVTLQAAALNRRDYWITLGMYPGITYPVVLGSDGAGVVTAVGGGVSQEWTEQEVIINPGMSWGENPRSQSDSFHILGLPTDGTLATQVAVPVSQLVKKPQHLTWQEAAALPLAGVTAYRGLFSQGQLQTGENVMITGVGGGVASMAVQYAVAAGATVFVTSSSAEKRQQALDLGVKAAFDYTENDWHKQCLKDHGAMNLIIDSAGGAGYRHLLDLAASGGRIVNYGATAGPPEKLDLFKVFWKQLHLIGSTMGSPDDFAAMISFVETHQIKPIIEQVFPLSQGNDALQVMANSSQFGKLVLDVNQ